MKYKHKDHELYTSEESYQKMSAARKSRYEPVNTDRQLRDQIMLTYETLQEIINNRHELTDNVVIDNDEVPLGAIIALSATDYARNVLELIDIIIENKKALGINPQKDIDLKEKLQKGFGI